MASKFELNDATPAAPVGRINIKWQSDSSGNVSANIPDPASGSYQTPWTSDIDGATHNLNNAGQINCCSLP